MSQREHAVVSICPRCERRQGCHFGEKFILCEMCNLSRKDIIGSSIILLKKPCAHCNPGASIIDFRRPFCPAINQKKVLFLTDERGEIVRCYFSGKEMTCGQCEAEGTAKCLKIKYKDQLYPKEYLVENALKRLYRPVVIQPLVFKEIP